MQSVILQIILTIALVIQVVNATQMFICYLFGTTMDAYAKTWTVDDFKVKSLFFNFLKSNIQQTVLLFNGRKDGASHVNPVGEESGNFSGSILKIFCLLS